MTEKHQASIRKLRLRFVGGLTLLVVLWALFYHIQFRGNASVAAIRQLAQRRIDFYTVEQELDRLTSYHDSIVETIINTHKNDVLLNGMILTKILGDGAAIDGMPADFIDENHAYIHITEDKVQIPGNIPADLSLEPSMFSEKTGWFFAGTKDPEQYIVYYYKLTDNTCIIKWMLYETSALYDYRKSEQLRDFNIINEVTGITILRFSSSGSGDGSAYLPLNIPKRFSTYQTPEDFGITSEMIDGAPDLGSGNLTAAGSASNNGLTGGALLTVDGKRYECYLRKSDNGTVLNVFMIPFDDSMALSAERTALLLAVCAIVSFSFLAWAFSVHALVIRYSLNAEQKKIFSPAIVYRRAATFILVGMLVVAGTSVFLQYIFENFSISATVEKSLQSLLVRLDFNQAWADEYKTMRMNTYETSSGVLSILSLSEDAWMDTNLLDAACRAIEADYIIIYDESGREIISNTGYKGLTLTEGGEDMRDFKRLLKGVSPISKQQVTDAQTGLTRSVFGATMTRLTDNANQDSAYWALLLFVDTDRVMSSSHLSTDEIMESIDSTGAKCFSVDPESMRIMSSSDPDFVGRNAADLGLPQEALREGYMGYFWMDDVQVYGASTIKDGILYCYTVNQQEIFQYVQKNALRGAVAFLGLITILAVVMLFGYRKTYELYADSGELLPESENMVLTPSGRRKLSVDPTFRWIFSDHQLGSGIPLSNALHAGEALYIIVVLITAIYVQVSVRRDSMNNSALTYILSGRWTKGMNLFAITNILFLLIEISVGTILIQFLIRLVTRYIGTKGETIGRLLLDFVGYISFILFFYFALSCIGVNTSALVASIGILSFALTLGAQDLVRDILAGLSTVLDGAYQVGDIIEVNGFRGTVLEVGVRTTKIEGRGGNILIMGNRDVKNVINRTRKNSWYALEFSVSEDEDLHKVESLLKEHLPQIGRDIPEIISGPFYKGVINIGNGKINLSVIAECAEENYYHVQRILNGSIALLLEKNNISIK